MAACTRLGQRAHAYGTSFDASACPGDNVAPHDVGSVATCQGGYDGLFDMNGNVEEWEDACTDVDGGRVCEKRGNDYQTAAGACNASFGEGIFEANIDTGIRCCAD
jgi:formylglycine-generating enzyme required for sulfatase activity